MTMREFYEVIGNVFENGNYEDKDEIVRIAQKELAAIDHKNLKAKERAAAKRSEGDALRAEIEALLGEEPMTIEDILNALGDEGLTHAKVVARMTQLVKAEKAEKATIKADGRKLVAYVAKA